MAKRISVAIIILIFLMLFVTTRSGDFEIETARAAPLPFSVLAETFTEADGTSGTDTYDIIRNAFCPGASYTKCIEAPDLYANNHPSGGRHITENTGSPYGPYFTFVLHDCCDIFIMSFTICKYDEDAAIARNFFESTICKGDSFS